MNDETLLRILERKRQFHPELRAAMTWEGLLRILAREGVLYASVPLSRRGKLLGCDGVWMILADNARRPRHLGIVAHELSHLWAHVDVKTDRYDFAFNQDDFDGDDPREAEAEYLAECIIYGPEYR